MSERKEVKRVPITDDDWNRLSLMLDQDNNAAAFIAKLLTKTVELTTLKRRQAWQEVATMCGYENTKAAREAGVVFSLDGENNEIIVYTED